MSVCSPLVGGGYPIPGLGGGGVPHPRSDGGGGTQSLVWMVGGAPSQVWKVGGTPSQVWMVRGVPHPRSRWWGGYPIPGLDGGGYPGYPLARSGWWGIPSTMTGWDIPPPWLDGVPPPTMTGWGTPHHDWMGYSPHQHSEHLLRDGRYASCVHAEELYCKLKQFLGCMLRKEKKHLIHTKTSFRHSWMSAYWILGWTKAGTSFFSVTGVWPMSFISSYVLDTTSGAVHGEGTSSTRGM